MSVKLFCVFATLIAFIACPFEASAQAQLKTFPSVDKDGNVTYVEAYEYGQVMEKPSFPGGDHLLKTFINTHRHYPEEAYNQRIGGRVCCWFIVNPDGKISNVNIVKRVNKFLEEEAIRIFMQMPAWEPGRIDGQAVPVRVIQTIRFSR